MQVPRPATVHDLWTLARRQWIDPAELAAAVEEQVRRGDLDFRTRLLIRDSLNALESHWAPERVRQVLASSDQWTKLEEIRRSELGPPGFPSLRQRLMEPTKPELVLQFLRELGEHASRPSRLDIGGSIALILSGNLSRHTEDIDVADEIPSEIRGQHDLLDTLLRRYSLRLAHFQSHYLPSGWAARTRSVGRFGQLDVYVADPYDIFVGKLFSAREKDLDDLRALTPQLDHEKIIARLHDSATPLLADGKLTANATRNWHILFGQPLPAS